MLRKVLYASVAIATAFTIAAPARAADEPKKPGLGQGQGREQMIKRFDKNGNGQLDPDEMQAAREAMQKLGGGQGGKPGQGMPNREEMIKKFDKNGNGQLDPDEMQAARQSMGGPGGRPGQGGKPGQGPGNGEMMKKFDKNGDGQLDDSEKAAMREAMQKLGGGNGPRKKPNNN